MIFFGGHTIESHLWGGKVRDGVLHDDRKRAAEGACPTAFKQPDEKLARPGTDSRLTPARIAAVFLTHAHIDHSGLLPLLVRQGLTARYIARATAALLDYVRFRLHKGWRASGRTGNLRRAGNLRSPPLYTCGDAKRRFGILNRLIQQRHNRRSRYRPYGMWTPASAGSASIELFITENGRRKKRCFRGYRQQGKPITRPSISKSGYRFMEGKYGDRLHEDVADTRKQLKEREAGRLRAAAISDTVFRGGAHAGSAVYDTRLLEEKACRG